MINTWWLICNSKEMSHPNPPGNAVRVGDGKTDFLEALADWLENGMMIFQPLRSHQTRHMRWY